MNEEGKQLKMSLSTLILLLIIGVMIILLLLMVILNTKKSSEISQLNENIVGLQSTITTMQKEKDDKAQKDAEEEEEKEEEKEKENEEEESEEAGDNWVIYPPNMDTEVGKWIGEEQDITSTPYKIMGKTLYSLSKKPAADNIKKIKEMYIDKLGLGDSTRIIKVDSNYERYEYPKVASEDINRKYDDVIKYSVAEFNEKYYDGGEDLEESVKKQYDKLVVEKDYGEYENVPEDFYYSIDGIIVANGNNSSKIDYEKNARAKKLRLTINGEVEYEIPLEDTNDVQIFDLDYKQENIEHPVNMEIEVLETYDGSDSKDVYISDLQFVIESNIPQGR